VTNAANSPIQRDIQALIGCTLNSAMKSNDIDVACLLEESRHTIIKQMTMSAAHSYRKAYPQLFNLQMLNEIEEAQKIWNSSDPEQKFNHLQKEWKRRSKLLIPSSQYELNLLQLRKAAFFDIRYLEYWKKY
jgi:serine/threonine-protein kinase ATR